MGLLFSSNSKTSGTAEAAERSIAKVPNIIITVKSNANILFIIVFLLSCQLHSVAYLGYDVGNKADDLTNKGGEQDRNEHDEYHCYDSSERCDKVL